MVLVRILASIVCSRIAFFQQIHPTCFASTALSWSSVHIASFSALYFPQPRMPSICDLPDEILLGVLRGLEAIRSYETQSIAFKHKGAEKGRQRENKIRQQALYALCLTSQRLRCISLPTLYASSITCATRMGLGKLELFHKTISSPENAIRQSKPLAEHLKYVENRLADYLGNSLQDDEVFQEKSVSRYFHLLSRVVLCAPNVENLCVVSLEHNEVSFWEHLFAKSYPSKNLIGHGLNKLKYLSVQMHAQTWFHVPRVAVFERLSLTFQSFTMLSELRISGAATNRDSGVVFYLGELPSLQRLELTECTRDVRGGSLATGLQQRPALHMQVGVPTWCMFWSLRTSCCSSSPRRHIGVSYFGHATSQILPIH